ncbi:MAG: hypothetical protein AAB726_00765 [Patescibacteria group bacterium]
MNGVLIFLIALAILALALLTNGDFFNKGPVRPGPLKLNINTHLNINIT